MTLIQTQSSSIFGEISDDDWQPTIGKYADMFNTRQDFTHSTPVSIKSKPNVYPGGKYGESKRTQKHVSNYKHRCVTEDSTGVHADRSRPYAVGASLKQPRQINEKYEGNDDDTSSVLSSNTVNGAHLQAHLHAAAGSPNNSAYSCTESHNKTLTAENEQTRISEPESDESGSESGSDDSTTDRATWMQPTLEE